MERDFDIGGRKFRLNKLDAFKQFHVVRRLGPILGDIIPVAKQFKNVNEKSMSEEQQFDLIAKLAQPIMTGLSKLTDVDAEIVLRGLCSCVEMKQDIGTWAKLVVNDMLMIQDLELPILLQIAGRSFAYNLSGFFAIAPQVSHGK